MNLSDEQKKIGKENFNDAVGVTRRDFLTGTVAAGLATGAGLGSIYFGYGKSVGDPLRIGVIGTGDEGSVLLGAHNPDYLNVVAIVPTTSSAPSTATCRARAPTRPGPA